MVVDCVRVSGKAAFTSFTQKARDEAQRRIPNNLSRKVEISTIHSLAFRDLNYRRDYILNNLTEFSQFIGESLEEENNLGFPRSRVSDILAFVSTWRNRCVEPTLSDFPKNIPHALSEFIIKQYYTFKENKALVDYTDILTRYIEDGEPLKVDYLFVDEAQDLTKLHWMAIEKMSRNCNILSVFGDDDQAIFAWAGSDAENLIDWEADATRILDYSHRLPKSIYRLSQDVIHQVEKRHEKEFRHNDAEGYVSYGSTINFDTDLTGYDSYGILYRNHVLADWVREEFHTRGIPYQDMFGPYNYKTDLQAIRDWEAWRDGQTILVRSIRNISKFTDLDLSRYDTGSAKNEVTEPCPSNLPWHEVLDVRYGLVYRKVYNRFGLDGLSQPSPITLSTIHHAKGGEWDKVILLTDMSKLTFDDYLKPWKKDNEHRVWYVGITRARKHLQLIRPQKDRHYPLLANYPLERLI